METTAHKILAIHLMKLTASATAFAQNTVHRNYYLPTLITDYDATNQLNHCILCNNKFGL